MFFDFDTTEAGGGSYPTPPDVPEPDIPECEECYEVDGLSDVDGHLLCKGCKADYIFRSTGHNDRMRFIRDNFEDQVNFYLKWYFDSLSDLEKLYIVRPYFDRSVEQSEKEFQSRMYVQECKSDFAEFMERVARYGA